MNKYILEHNFPQDLKEMSYDELELLSYEIRDFLVEEVSKTGGHLASNLGVVEIAIALHRCFDTPEDKIIWDVGHQTYVHKILTGRAEKFHGLRQLDGMSGFPKTCESEYDLFDTGHSSNSISLGLGMAAARDLAGDDYKVISVIGDGAMTGGEAFEALNNAGNMNTNMIVVLNDNGMSISSNTGGLPRYLRRLRSSHGYQTAKKSIKKNVAKVPIIGEGMVSGMQHARDSIKYAVIDGAMFEQLGFMYLGPVDGHNVRDVCEVLEEAASIDGPVFVHLMTKKGKGYSKAEEKPNVFHGIGPFDVESGEPLKKSATPSYSSVFGRCLTDMAVEDKKIVAVSAAMIEGVGLEGFAKAFPDRTFDVGIAEGHAVSFAAGLAKAGLKPFVAIYSTFLQRAYDQIIEDVCLQNLPVVFCIDRAGVVGADGETHHGLFDISYMKNMPNMTVMAPSNDREFRQMLKLANELDGPCTIRYPRGSAPVVEACPEIGVGKALRLSEGTDIDIWALGNMVPHAVEAAKLLEEKGISAGVVDMRFAKPIDTDMLTLSAAEHRLIITVEDGICAGGVGEAVASVLSDSAVHVVTLGWPDRFIEHGTQNELYERYGLDARGIYETAIRCSDN